MNAHRSGSKVGVIKGRLSFVCHVMWKVISVYERFDIVDLAVPLFEHSHAIYVRFGEKISRPFQRPYRSGLF